jgi:glycosyltransferase involved in cell wall biosynthesis
MSQLRIAIDAQRLLSGTLSSGATYLRSLLGEWQREAVPCRFLLFLPWRPPAGHPDEPLFSAPNIELAIPDQEHDPDARYLAQVYWQQAIIPALLRRHRPDVFFSTFHLTPLWPPGQRVVTAVHDLCFLHEPFFSVRGLVHRTEMLSACLRARRLICVSEFTHRMLARWRPRAARKATVVPHGLTEPALADGEARRLLAEGGVAVTPGQYALWIGSPNARKNPALMFEAFAVHRARHPAHKLVLIAPASAHALLRVLAEPWSLGDSLVLLSGISESLRSALYREALALIFPSLCEGFGYPILEAMAQGCPVVAYSQGPAAELAGGVVPLADHLSESAFSSLLDRYAALGSAERMDLSSRLVERARRFSLGAMAGRTLEVLCSAARVKTA